jgi:thiosulfate dehydrogenase [quinone] large subunit
LNEGREVISVAVSEDAAPSAGFVRSRVDRSLLAVLRIGVGLLWLQNVGWKIPPDFGRGDPPSGLYRFTGYAVEYEVFPPYAWFVDRVVLPNFTVFGWLVLLVEAALGAFLLIGLATRFWAVVGVAQTVAITLSVLNAPDEWVWSYLLMLLAHAAVFATAAGRYAGLDGLLRPGWQRSQAWWARWLVRAS